MPTFVIFKVLFKDLGVNVAKNLLKAIGKNQFKNFKGEWMLSNNDEPNHFLQKGIVVKAQRIKYYIKFH